MSTKSWKSKRWLQLFLTVKELLPWQHSLLFQVFDILVEVTIWLALESRSHIEYTHVFRECCKDHTIHVTVSYTPVYVEPIAKLEVVDTPHIRTCLPRSRTFWLSSLSLIIPCVNTGSVPISWVCCNNRTTFLRSSIADDEYFISGQRKWFVQQISHRLFTLKEQYFSQTFTSIILWRKRNSKCPLFIVL